MNQNQPKLFFKCDDIDDFDTEMKGYRNDVFVILPSGEIYEVFFYDIVRLSQDMGAGLFIAPPGLIVIERVNKAFMEAAVIDLWEKGFFNYFIPRKSLSTKHFDENI